MMVARCCDGMRAFSQPCLTGSEMPNATIETRYSGTATQKFWISAAPIDRHRRHPRADHEDEAAVGPARGDASDQHVAEDLREPDAARR